MKMKKHTDKDKAGITTGTTMIKGMGHGHGEGNPAEMKSKGKDQKPAGGLHESASRGQKIKV